MTTYQRKHRLKRGRGLEAWSHVFENVFVQGESRSGGLKAKWWFPQFAFFPVFIGISIRTPLPDTTTLRRVCLNTFPKGISAPSLPAASSEVHSTNLFCSYQAVVSVCPLSPFLPFHFSFHAVNTYFTSFASSISFPSAKVAFYSPPLLRKH